MTKTKKRPAIVGESDWPLVATTWEHSYDVTDMEEASIIGHRIIRVRQLVSKGTIICAECNFWKEPNGPRIRVWLSADATGADIRQAIHEVCKDIAADDNCPHVFPSQNIAELWQALADECVENLTAPLLSCWANA